MHGPGQSAPGRNRPCDTRFRNMRCTAVALRAILRPGGPIEVAGFAVWFVGALLIGVLVLALTQTR